jgi:hypothetical protein
LSYYTHKIEDEKSKVHGMPEREENTHRVLVEKPDEKKPLGKPTCDTKL